MPGEAMKCAEFTEIVHELARPGYLDGSQTAMARAHAESCRACGSLLAEAERLAVVLRKTSAESRRFEAPARVESALMAGFRAASAAAPQRPPRWKTRWLWAVGAAGAVALASLLLFVSLAGLPGRHPVPAVPGAAMGSASVAVAEPKTPAQNTAAQAGNFGAASNTSLASEFVPVPFSGGLARGDAGVIVRVQVPRAALAELGYPVDETQGGGVVQADLLVGEDGWPHAVRIVR